MPNAADPFARGAGRAAPHGMAEGLLHWVGPESALEATRLLDRLGYVVVLADEEAAGLPAPLSEEIAGATRAMHSRGYLIRRGIARALAAQVFKGSARDYSIEQEASGAPKLAGPGNPNALHPNALHVSFSARGAVGVIAIGRTPLGVDYETTLPPAEIPWNILRPDERRALEHLPAEHRDEAFLALWRGKEAALKALGLGFARPPEAVHMSAEQAWVDGRPAPLRLVSFPHASVTLAILMA